jgi:hypothetical protein
MQDAALPETGTKIFPVSFSSGCEEEYDIMRHWRRVVVSLVTATEVTLCIMLYVVADLSLYAPNVIWPTGQKIL